MAGSSAAKVHKGAYVLQDEANFKVILTGTGSEVQLLTKAAAMLKSKGMPARVVSFPCWELYEKQSAEYKASVFPEGIPVLSVEAAATHGWGKYSHGAIGMHTFGASGKGEEVFKHFGFTPENIAEKAQKLVAAFPKGAPSLFKPFM